MVGKGGRFEYTHLSWHSAFDSCELFYSHVTDCIKRTSGTVIDAFIVSTFLALFPSVYNESFIKLIPFREFNSPYEYAVENGFSLLFRIFEHREFVTIFMIEQIISIPLYLIYKTGDFSDGRSCFFILFVFYSSSIRRFELRDPPRAGLYGKFVSNEERFERTMDTYME